jgi:predicted nucleic acid-binding protein
MFLLDTNVISELRKAGDGKADARVVAWISSVDAGTFYLSAVTLMELELGTLLLERRDPIQGAGLRAWMDGHVLP